MLYLSFEDYADVWHVSDDFISDAIAETATIGVLAELLASKQVSVFNEMGTDILDELRGSFLLEDYSRSNTFESYLCGVLEEAAYEYGYVDITTERYDHKRGRCDVSASVKVPVSEVVALGESADSVLANWRVTIETKNGKLTLD